MESDIGIDSFAPTVEEIIILRGDEERRLSRRKLCHVVFPGFLSKMFGISQTFSISLAGKPKENWVVRLRRASLKFMTPVTQEELSIEIFSMHTERLKVLSCAEERERSKLIDSFTINSPI